MAELELKEVSYFYESGGKRIDILDKASYSFEKGTLYTIVGPSGSGKTRHAPYPDHRTHPPDNDSTSRVYAQATWRVVPRQNPV
mgnify:CR=1 FL=1